jgi:hypothetical protein
MATSRIIAVSSAILRTELRVLLARYEAPCRLQLKRLCASWSVRLPGRIHGRS